MCQAKTICSKSSVLNTMITRRRFLFNLFKYKRKLIAQVSANSRYLTVSAICHAQAPKILFFGTDNFSLPSLKLLYKNTDIKLGTVTSFKNPANCIRQYAEKNNLPLYRWPIDAEICRKFDLGVVVSFGHLIPTNIIKSLPLGMINVHASLLPRWRGAAPIIYALMHGDVETGVSIMKIEPKHFDIGDILAQDRVPIQENCLMPELHTILANKGAELLLKVVRDYPEKLRHAKKQDENFVTYAPKVTTSVTEIVWSDLSALEIYNRYRALYGFKNLVTKFQSNQVQLIEIRIPTMEVQYTAKVFFKDYTAPGSFMYSRDRKCVLVRCSSDSFIEILQLRIEGRKIMSAQDFNNGFLKKLKTINVHFVDNKCLPFFS